MELDRLVGQTAQAEGGHLRSWRDRRERFRGLRRLRITTNVNSNNAHLKISKIFNGKKFQNVLNIDQFFQIYFILVYLVGVSIDQAVNMIVMVFTETTIKSNPSLSFDLKIL